MNRRELMGLVPAVPLLPKREHDRGIDGNRAWVGVHAIRKWQSEGWRIVGARENKPVWHEKQQIVLMERIPRDEWEAHCRFLEGFRERRRKYRERKGG